MERKRTWGKEKKADVAGSGNETIGDLGRCATLERKKGDRQNFKPKRGR